METEAGEHVLFEGHPSWRSTLGFYIKGLLLAALPGVIVAVAASTGAGVGVFLAIFVLAVVVGFVRRIATRYAISNRRLQIRRGIFSRKVQEARLERVQNVNTTQSILERILQVGTVDFDTAGTGDADFAFRGVSQPEKVMRKVDQAQQEASAATAQPAAGVEAATGGEPKSGP